MEGGAVTIACHDAELESVRPTEVPLSSNEGAGVSDNHYAASTASDSDLDTPRFKVQTYHGAGEGWEP